MGKNVVIIGAGGHAKVIADIIIKSGDNIIGFLDDNIAINNKILGYHIIGKISDIPKLSEKNDYFYALGIGSNSIRKKIYERYNIKYYTAIHPSSQIAIDTEIGEGSVIMATAIINTSTKIGKCCIINTGSIIEHDNIIGDYVHISPNATLSGTVRIGDLTHVGTNASIKNNIEIANNCIIGVGSVVVKNILESNGVYVGIPAKKMKNI